MIGLFKRWRLRDDEAGSPTVEFALLLTPMLFMLMGSVEITYFAYVKAVVNGAVRDVARSISTGQYSGPEIDARVKAKLATVGIKPADITMQTQAYSAFESSASKPEPLTQDVAPLGQANVGDCYYDLNKNGVWNANTSGGPEDILHYTVTAKYKLLFPFIQSVMGATNGYMTVKSMTTIKNEPFNNNAPELCITDASKIGS